MDDNWWKTTPDTEGDDEEEVAFNNEQAGAEGDDGADEENQEASLRAPATDKGPSNSDPPAAATTSSGSRQVTRTLLQLLQRTPKRGIRQPLQRCLSVDFLQLEVQVLRIISLHRVWRLRRRGNYAVVGQLMLH